MAGERVWLLDGGGAPTPLEESPYPHEAALQRLIADCPEVLAGEQMTPGEPRRWLPVRREMGIADGAGAGDRWSVDHLLIDQDARPTLVEVKLEDNTEIRRKVVGQLLEYAAHATRYWAAGGSTPLGDIPRPRGVARRVPAGRGADPRAARDGAEHDRLRDDGLIDVRNLAQLGAIRHDLDGSCDPSATGATAYDVAFPTASRRRAGAWAAPPREAAPATSCAPTSASTRTATGR